MNANTSTALSGRPDFEAIADWVQPGASVLDLGCATACC